MGRILICLCNVELKVRRRRRVRSLFIELESLSFFFFFFPTLSISSAVQSMSLAWALTCNYSRDDNAGSRRSPQKSIMVKLQPIERPANYQRRQGQSQKEKNRGITKYAISIKPLGIPMEGTQNVGKIPIKKKCFPPALEGRVLSFYIYWVASSEQQWWLWELSHLDIDLGLAMERPREINGLITVNCRECLHLLVLMVQLQFKGRWTE